MSVYIFDTGIELLLSRRQRIMLALFNRVFLGRYKKPGWKDYIPAYAKKCPVHGYVMHQTRGGMGTVLCPLCLAEAKTQ